MTNDDIRKGGRFANRISALIRISSFGLRVLLFGDFFGGFFLGFGGGLFGGAFGKGFVVFFPGF